MRPLTALLLAGSWLLPSALAISGRSWTSWDCCKPACAWPHVTKGLRLNGYPKVCNKANEPLRDGQNATSSCAEGGGAGYLCSSYAPVPVADDRAYGFAIMSRNDACCKCYEVRWTSGAARAKTMVVQAINVGPAGGDVGADDVIVLTPGGGVGPNSGGCKSQYGRTWGDKNGGVFERRDCESLPQNLQGGCYWRWNWAKGDINGWNVDYRQVSCPSRLTSISGCSAG